MFRELLDRFLSKNPQAQKPIQEIFDKGIDDILEGAVQQDRDLAQIFQQADKNPSALTAVLPRAVDYCRKKAQELAAKAAEHEKKAKEIEQSADLGGSEIMLEALTDEIEDQEMDRDSVFQQSRHYRVVGRTYNNVYRLVEGTAFVEMLPALEAVKELREFASEREDEAREYASGDESEKRRHAIRQRLLAGQQKSAAGKEGRAARLGSEPEAEVSDA